MARIELRKRGPIGFRAPTDEQIVIVACHQILEDAELWPWPGYDEDGNPLDQPPQP